MDLQPPDLQFTTRWMNGHQIVAIAGDIDACTAPAMLAYVLNAAADSDGGAGGSDLVMDLSAVTFMDASGLSALMRADGGARQAGRHLRLAAPRRNSRMAALGECRQEDPAQGRSGQGRRQSSRKIGTHHRVQFLAPVVYLVVLVEVDPALVKRRQRFFCEQGRDRPGLSSDIERGN